MERIIKEVSRFNAIKFNVSHVLNALEYKDDIFQEDWKLPEEAFGNQAGPN